MRSRFQECVGSPEYGKADRHNGSNTCHICTCRYTLHQPDFWVHIQTVQASSHGREGTLTVSLIYTCIDVPSHTIHLPACTQISVRPADLQDLLELLYLCPMLITLSGCMDLSSGVLYLLLNSLQACDSTGGYVQAVNNFVNSQQ